MTGVPITVEDVLAMLDPALADQARGGEPIVCPACGLAHLAIAPNGNGAHLDCEAGCEPRTVVAELRRLARAGAFSARLGENLPIRIKLEETDLGNARRLVLDHRGDLHYAYGVGWLAWDHTRWAPDRDGEAERRAKQTVDHIADEANALREQAAKSTDDTEREKLGKKATRRFAHAVKSQHRSRLEAVLAVARSEQKIVVDADDLDRDPWQLNVANGTLDLRTGELRPHDRRDLLTKIAPVIHEPDAACPHWLDALATWLGGDEDLVRYLQRAAGYTLTGDTSEQCLFLLEGDGANGKSTFLAALTHVLGDYAIAADAQTFTTAGSNRAARSDIARLRGARLVTADEIEHDAHLAEALVKKLTGGDRITARYNRENEFEYVPAMKLWLGVNHLPGVRGDDHAIWRRLKVIPFHHRVARPDRHLAARLRKEASGILAWAVQGAGEWRKHGLGTTPAVDKAGSTYREDQDVVGQFIAEMCVPDPAAKTLNTDLRAAYEAWEHKAGRQPIRDFLDRLKAHGFEAGASNGKRLHKGVRILHSATSVTGSDT